MTRLSIPIRYEDWTNHRGGMPLEDIYEAVLQAVDSSSIVLMIGRHTWLTFLRHPDVVDFLKQHIAQFITFTATRSQTAWIYKQALAFLLGVDELKLAPGAGAWLECETETT